MVRIADSKGVVKSDLWIAHQLVTGGTPLTLFVLHSRNKGYSAVDKGFLDTEPSENILHRWLDYREPGNLLAALTGRVYDVFDFDAQNDGHLSEFLEYFASLGHKSLTVQAVVATPSGGYHLWVNTLGRRKKPIARGIDYQGLRGIAFIPPSKKLSKRTGEMLQYRWVEYSPSGEDSGEEIYKAISEWPHHAPLPATSITKTGFSGITRSDIARYVTEGLDAGINHDDTLKDIVWRLCQWHATEEEALDIWQQIVDKTAEKGGKRTYEADRDFRQRHWAGAERKLRG